MNVILLGTIIQAMKLTDVQTQEEITLNSLAQQASQPTMSAQ